MDRQTREQERHTTTKTDNEHQKLKTNEKHGPLKILGRQQVLRKGRWSVVIRDTDIP